MLSSLLDRSFDWTVVPGYSRLGYAVRSRSWADERPPGGLAGWSFLVTGASAGIGAATCERHGSRNAPPRSSPGPSRV